MISTVLKTIFLSMIAAVFLYLLAGQVSTGNATGSAFGLLLLVAVFYSAMLRDEYRAMSNYIRKLHDDEL